MSAIIIVMPVAPRPAFHDPSWREQYARECAALCAARREAPPRTRPLKVIDNTSSPAVVAIFEGVLSAMAAALNDEPA